MLAAWCVAHPVTSAAMRIAAAATTGALSKRSSTQDHPSGREDSPRRKRGVEVATLRERGGDSLPLRQAGASGKGHFHYAG